MSKKPFIVRASVIAIAVLSIVLFKPTDVKAYNSGCDIVSPSTMVNRYADIPIDSTDGTWQSWIDWYATNGYTYTGYSDASGDVTAYWMNLQKGSELYYAFLYKHPTLDRYWSPYKQWIKVDGAYYYTNELGIVYRNTWVWTRTNNESAAATDPHGYFVFDNSGKMCTGWHKGSDDRWYYMRIDHTYNKDGPCMKVGVDSGFLWETVKEPTTYSEGLYYFTGVNVTTNVYIMGTDGSYPTKVPDTDKKLDFVKVDDIQPLSGAKTYKPNADFVKGKYEKIKYLSLNTEKSASLAETKQINIVNDDYREYSIKTFNYYVDRSKYKQTVQVRYQKADGNWGDYSNVIYADYYYGAEVSWSRKADNTYNAASIKYTVTEAATKKVDVKRKQYTQTINFNTYGASGTYNKPTYKTTYLNKKTYNSYYGSTFNAKSHGADYGNAAGYHWWKVDNNSWTVTGDASTNSYYYPNKYRLYVDVAGGSGTNGNFDMEYGTSIDLGTPTRTGWKFTGWTKIYDNSTNSTLSGNQFVMGYSNTYPYQDYMTEPSVKIIANWQDVTAPNASDTILTATNPAKTI